MSLHSATWRVHVSELDDLALIIESIKWIAGDNALINIENGKSIHGAKTEDNNSTKSKTRENHVNHFSGLGKAALTEIVGEDITKRIDENKNLHIRIDVSNLVSREIK